MDADFKEPWVKVGQFADNLVHELRREVVLGHPLWSKDVRAIAQRIDSDDVLFEVVGDTTTYAVVHLSWRGSFESIPLFPEVKLFSSFDHWVHEGMNPDHGEFVGEIPALEPEENRGHP